MDSTPVLMNKKNQRVGPEICGLRNFPGDFDTSQSWESLRICISNKLPQDADNADVEITYLEWLIQS